jgi:conjugative transfer pilus assembly protein TraH
MPSRSRSVAVRGAVVALTTILGAAAPTAEAGDLNAEVNAMFNSLGTLGNYTAPGAFKGQTFNTYAGGSIYLRSPTRTYQLASIALPDASGGCGGINVFGGSFSHISATEFKNMLQNITAALPGIAFQLALETVSPLLGGLTKWAKSFENFVNNARINSCETAKGLVAAAADKAGLRSDDACASVAQMLFGEDRDAAKRRCQVDRPNVLAAGRASADPKVRAVTPFTGNWTWEALKKVNTIDDPTREIVMSLVGTVIFHPEPTAGTPATDPTTHEPTIRSAKYLLKGESDAGAGAIKVLVLKCNDYTTCNVVTPTLQDHVPFTKLVRDRMYSISNAIASRGAIPNNSADVGFVNATSAPVYRMLAVGNTIPGSGLASTLIETYADGIAAEYAQSFLDSYLQVGIGALARDWKIDEPQRPAVTQLASNARALLNQLQAELQGYRTAQIGAGVMAGELERLERQLRSQLPQHVMDMLGHGAQATR